MDNLKQYYQWLAAHNAAHPISGRPETPAHFNFKTLWIPVYTGNRTACFDLNHTINGFDGSGLLCGENGNCCTPYVIVEVPKAWTEAELEELARLVCIRLKKAADYPRFRVLKADDRLPVIMEFIGKMIAEGNTREPNPKP